MDKNKQIKELMSKGFTKNQAAMICMSKESMQEGGGFNYDKTGNKSINLQDVANINKSTGIEFTPEFSQSYFSQQSQPTTPTPQIDYSKQPIVDITSDGLFTDRKVWRTHKPEWFLGKVDAAEGKDYTRVPYKQWQEYQKSPEYSTYLNRGKVNSQLVSMQKGGYWENNNPYFMQNPGVVTPTGQIPSTTYMQQPAPIDYNKDYMAMTTAQEQLQPLTTEAITQADTTAKPEIYNPFGGIGLEQSLYIAGQGLGEGDPWKASTGIGLSALKIGRTGLSGYATGKENARVAEEMRRKQFEDMRRPQVFQEGGKTISNAAVMTGKFIVDQPNPNTNVELEGDEFVKENQTGEIKKVIGEGHEKNGVQTSLEDAKILSDYTKIGAKNAKELKDKYNLSVKKTDTFAKVMDKVNKQLGVDELVKEQTEYIEKLGDNEATKSEGTKKVNDEFLNKEIKDKEDKLNELKGAQNFAFEDIFSRQEQIPKKGKEGEILDDKGNPIDQIPSDKMQQGGHILELAKKHGLSTERAQELMMFQQGGIQNSQEEQVEGQSSNSQEEQGEIQPQQIVEAFAQATQQDPNAIMQQLQQMSPEEQQQALSQMMQQLQGQQSPQEEQIEGNASNPQEEGQEQAPQEMMQEGGYTKEQQTSRLNDFYNQVSGLGYEGKKDIGSMQNWMASNYPQEVVNYFTKNGQPLTAKHVDIIKDKYKNIFKETGIPANKKSEDYTSEEKLKLQTALGDKANSDFLLQGFKDNKWDWRFPMVSQQNIKPIQGMPQAQILAPSMSRFSSPQNEVSQEEPITPSQETEQARPKAKSNMVAPNMPIDYLLPPSAMQAINKPYVPLGRIQPIKLTAEPMLAESARQAQTSLEALRATGLPPQIQEALSAQQLATTQGASNDAIAKTEQFNAQNQFQADQFNIGQASKEDLMNTQYAQDYQDKMMQTIANQERDMRRYYNELNNQNRANFNYIDRRNIANQAFSNFSTTGSDVTYNPSSKVYTLPGGETVDATVWNNMTAEQQTAYRDQKLKDMQNANTMKSYKKA